jgi:hypothetical protein
MIDTGRNSASKEEVGRADQQQRCREASLYPGIYATGHRAGGGVYPTERIEVQCAPVY